MADLLPGWPPELGSVGGTRTECECGSVSFNLDTLDRVLICDECGGAVEIGALRHDSVLTMLVYESGGRA